MEKSASARNAPTTWPTARKASPSGVPKTMWMKSPEAGERLEAEEEHEQDAGLERPDPQADQHDEGHPGISRLRWETTTVSTSRQTSGRPASIRRLTS